MQVFGKLESLAVHSQEIDQIKHNLIKLQSDITESKTQVNEEQLENLTHDI